MTSVRLSDALRLRYLALLEHNLRGRPVPGGDVTAWVAPVPTAALVEILLHPPELTRALVFTAVGEARLRTVTAYGQDLFSGALDNVPLSDTAQASLMAWAACRLAREQLDAGFAAEAQRVLMNATRLIHEWPTPIARRFEPRIEALYASADRMRSHQLAQEVA